MKKTFLSLALTVCAITANAQYFDRELTDTARISVLHNDKGEELSLTAIRFDRDSTGTASCVIEYNRPAADLYLYSHIWLATHVPQYSANKLMEDNHNHVAIVRYPVNLYTTSNKQNRIITHSGTQFPTITIRCKEGRLRIEISNYYATYSDQVPFRTVMETLKNHTLELYTLTRDWITPASFDLQYTKILNNIVKSLAQSIINQDKANDF